MTLLWLLLKSQKIFQLEYSRIDGLFEITWIKIGKTLLNSIESAFSKLNVGTKNFDKGSSSNNQNKQTMFRGGRNFRGRNWFSRSRGKTNFTRKNSGEIFNKSVTICKKNGHLKRCYFKGKPQCVIAKDLFIYKKIVDWKLINKQIFLGKKKVTVVVLRL